MILVHVPEVNNRLKYTFDLVFKGLLKVEYNFTSNLEEFTLSTQPKFSYGKSQIGDFLFIKSVDLLYERDLHRQVIQFGAWKDLPVFFKTDDNSTIPFDVFAASFYLVSRYEEYLPHIRDRHDRFQSEEGAAYKGKFLDRPMVNLWVMELRKILQEKFPELHFPNQFFTFTPTIDIDNAYAYKNKGFVRAVLGLSEKLIKFQLKKFSNRLAVHLGFRRDPYDSYDRQGLIHEMYNIKPIYFILLGDYGMYDKNISPRSRSFVKLVKSLQQKGGFIGLHPSYASNKLEFKLSKEKNRLEKILDQEVYKSRQHYIKMSFPGTYRNLIKLGIKEDYSMGYPSKVGFRASICNPYYFFDIEENKQTDLKIFPFVAMDSTFKYYLKFRSKEVIPYLKPIVEEIKSVGGDFVFIFHNESIGNGRNWRNWGNIYEEVIKLSMQVK